MKKTLVAVARETPCKVLLGPEAKRKRPAIIAQHKQWLPKPDAPLAQGSAERILVYDAAKDEAVRENRIPIRRSDPIP